MSYTRVEGASWGYKTVQVWEHNVQQMVLLQKISIYPHTL